MARGMGISAFSSLLLGAWLGCLSALAGDVQGDVAAAGAAAAALSQGAALQPGQGSGAPAPAAAATLPGDPPDPAADALFAWVRAHGGEVNIAVRSEPGCGRATFAPRAFKKGEVLAAVPVELCYRSVDINQDMAGAGMALAADLLDPSSPHAPYFAALPRPGEVWSLHNFPQGYVHLLQNNATEAALRADDRRLRSSWAERGAALREETGCANATLEDVRHALTLLLTRLFNFNQDGLLLIPVVDLANHRYSCQYSHLKERCRPGGDAQCMVWRTMEDLRAGEEVCLAYKPMTNDRSLLQYGFLQSTEESTFLSYVDRHDFDPREPWGDLPWGPAGPPRAEGPPEWIDGELARLEALLASLRGHDATAAATPAAPEDRGGWYLSQLLEWRRQRQRAIAAELGRLRRQRGRLAAARARLPGEPGAAAEQQRRLDLLAARMRAGGALLNVEARAVDPAAEPSCADAAADKAGGPGAAAAGTCASHLLDGGGAEGGAGGPPPPPPPPALALARAPFTRLVASARVRTGGLLAAVPLAQAVAVKDGDEGLLESAMVLAMRLHELAHPESPVGPNITNETAPLPELLAALPPPGGAWSLFSLPPEYLPLLQSEALERHVAAAQRRLRSYWDANRPAVEAQDPSLSLAEYQHAASLISSRLLAYEQGAFLVPPLAFADPATNNGCPHADRVAPCPPAAAGGGHAGAGEEGPLCVVWEAGTDLREGEEVCLSYGHLLPDTSLLQYGRLQPHWPPAAEGAEGGGGPGGAAPPPLLPPPLSAVDRHDFDPQNPFAPPASGHDAPPAFQGTAEQALAEAARLATLFHHLASPEAEALAASAAPAPADRGGALLARVLEWRRQRAAALEAEVGRLMELHGLDDAAVEEEMGRRAEEERRRAAEAEAAAARASAGASAGQAELDGLVGWMKAHGAVVNVAVRDTRGPAGRAVFAAGHVRRGDLLAAIPLDLGFSQGLQGGNGSYELMAANLWAAMKDHSGFLQPYLKTLPSKRELLSPLASMPEQYLPLLQSEGAAQAVRDFQRRIDEFWSEHHHDLTAAVQGLQPGDLRYARALVSTRMFGHRSRGSTLIPLLDLANHRLDCPHHHEPCPCPHNASAECVCWRAGAYLSPGQECCNFYKHMANDRALLQYGFLQDGAASLLLSGVDRHDYESAGGFWSAAGLADKLGPEPFSGTVEETRAEVGRLERLGEELGRGDAQAAAAEPAPGDEGGRLLSLLREWRRQRAAAVGAEAARLRGELRRLEALAQGEAPPPGPPPAEALMQWLEDNGAQVSSVVVRPSPGAGNAVFAASPVPAGGLLASIPLGLAVPVYTANMLEEAPKLWRDMVHPRSRAAPYWRSLPPRGEVRSFYGLPPSYLALVQHEAAESHVRASREAARRFAEGNPELMAASGNMTEGDLLHVMALVATRVWDFELRGAHLVPLLDMANHRNGCPHTLRVDACPLPPPPPPRQGAASPRGSAAPAGAWCVLWRAGADLRAGEEVCVSYGHLLPDRAMLQYGFLQGRAPGGGGGGQGEGGAGGGADGGAGGGAGGAAAPPELCGADRHDFPIGAEPWTFRLDQFGPPEPFQGTREEVAAELGRLRRLAGTLAAGDAAAAAVAPDAVADPDGSLLADLREWRRRRQEGVAAEVARLERLAGGGGGGATAS